MQRSDKTTTSRVLDPWKNLSFQVSTRNHNVEDDHRYHLCIPDNTYQDHHTVPLPKLYISSCILTQNRKILVVHYHKTIITNWNRNFYKIIFSYGLLGAFIFPSVCHFYTATIYGHADDLGAWMKTPAGQLNYIVSWYIIKYYVGTQKAEIYTSKNTRHYCKFTKIILNIKSKVL